MPNDMVECPEFIRLSRDQWVRLLTRFQNLKGMLNYTTACLRGFEEENKKLRERLQFAEDAKIARMEYENNCLRNNVHL